MQNNHMEYGLKDKLLNLQTTHFFTMLSCQQEGEIW